MLQYKKLSELPTPSEYIALRSAAGLSRRTKKAAQMGLRNSLFSVRIRNANDLIAMGRIVGDGGCHFEIVDVIVHPDFRRCGLGSQVMTELIEYLRSNVPKSAHISVVADEGAPALYHKFGFRPSSPSSFGMILEV